MNADHRVIILVSNVGLTSNIEADQRRCLDLFRAKGITFNEMDSALPENREKRDFLFSLSQVRIFPQVFIEKEAEVAEYIGSWEKIQQLLDSNDIPSEVLSAHPEIDTFDKVFEKVLMN